MDAARHHSQMMDHLLMRGNMASSVSAGRSSCAISPSNDDDAYQSEEMETKLRDRILMTHIDHEGEGQDWEEAPCLQHALPLPTAPRQPNSGVKDDWPKTKIMRRITKTDLKWAAIHKIHSNTLTADSLRCASG